MQLKVSKRLQTSSSYKGQCCPGCRHFRRQEAVVHVCRDHELVELYWKCPNHHCTHPRSFILATDDHEFAERDLWEA